MRWIARQSCRLCWVVALALVPNLAWGQSEEPIPTSQAAVVIKTTILAIDTERLAEVAPELLKLPTAAGELTDAAIERRRPCVGVLANSKAESLLESLRDEGRAQIICQPQVCTLLGQPAQVETGSELPILARTTTLNGQRTVDLECRRVGTALTVTPRSLADDRLQIEMTVTSSRLEPATVDSPANHVVHKFQTTAAFEAGQTLVIVDSPPFHIRPSPDSDLGSACIVLVTPEPVDDSLNFEETLPPPLAPTSTAEPPYSLALPTVQPPRAGLESVEALRDEVRQLRREVRRLIELLEEGADPAGDSSARSHSSAPGRQAHTATAATSARRK